MAVAYWIGQLSKVAGRIWHRRDVGTLSEVVPGVDFDPVGSVGDDRTPLSHQSFAAVKLVISATDSILLATPVVRRHARHREFAKGVRRGGGVGIAFRQLQRQARSSP